MIQTIRQECHVRNTCLNVVSLAVVYLLKCCKGSPSLKNVGSIWALPKWGGGLDPCPNGLGHLF